MTTAFASIPACLLASGFYIIRRMAIYEFSLMQYKILSSSQKLFNLQSQVWAIDFRWSTPAE